MANALAMKMLGLTTLWYLANGSHTEFLNSSFVWQTTTYNPTGFNNIHIEITIFFIIERISLSPRLGTHM
jgi:hypothetical protein